MLLLLLCSDGQKGAVTLPNVSNMKLCHTVPAGKLLFLSVPMCSWPWEPVADGVIFMEELRGVINV